MDISDLMTHARLLGIDPPEPIDVEYSFRNMLDDCYGECSVAGKTYYTSYAARKLDPTVYMVGMLEYIDAMVKDGDWATEDGETCYLQRDINALAEAIAECGGEP